MGKVNTLKESFFRSRKNKKALAKKNGKAPANRHKVLFEPLEPRVLMAAEPWNYTFDGGKMVEVHYDGSQYLQIREQNAETKQYTVLEQHQLSDVSSLTITGTGSYDWSSNGLRVDLENPFFVAGGLKIIYDLLLYRNFQKADLH